VVLQLELSALVQLELRRRLHDSALDTHSLHLDIVGGHYQFIDICFFGAYLLDVAEATMVVLGPLVGQVDIVRVGVVLNLDRDWLTFWNGFYSAWHTDPIRLNN
jgi:hypothetical protein